MKQKTSEGGGLCCHASQFETPRSCHPTYRNAAWPCGTLVQVNQRVADNERMFSQHLTGVDKMHTCSVICDPD